jgi:hypothetical protein
MPSNLFFYFDFHPHSFYYIFYVVNFFPGYILWCLTCSGLDFTVFPFDMLPNLMIQVTSFKCQYSWKFFFSSFSFMILSFFIIIFWKKKKRFCGYLQFLSDRFVLVLLLRPGVLQVFLDKGFFLKKIYCFVFNFWRFFILFYIDKFCFLEIIFMICSVTHSSFSFNFIHSISYVLLFIISFIDFNK